MRFHFLLSIFHRNILDHMLYTLCKLAKIFNEEMVASGDDRFSKGVVTFSCPFHQSRFLDVSKDWHTISLHVFKRVRGRMELTPLPFASLHSCPVVYVYSDCMACMIFLTLYIPMNFPWFSTVLKWTKGDLFSRARFPDLMHHELCLNVGLPCVDVGVV